MTNDQINSEALRRDWVARRLERIRAEADASDRNRTADRGFGVCVEAAERAVKEEVC
jgi:hypothetical protein